MSRAWLPRRIRGVIPWLAVAVWAALGAAAFAQPTANPRNVAGMASIFGDNEQGRRCATGVVTNDSSDAIVDACTRGLQYRLLTPAAAAQLMVSRGIVRLRRSEGEAALADFDAVMERDPDNAEVMVNRGSALIMLHRYGEAIAAMTRALGLGVMSPHKAYFNRGAAREALGDLRGAYEDYSTALAIEPDWGPAEQELARFARTRRDRLASRLGDEPNPMPE